MKKIIMLAALLTGGQICFPQFNDSTHYYINYASTGVFNKTNDNNSFVLHDALKFNYSRRGLAINTTNAWIYGEQQSHLTNNDYSTGLDFDLNKSLRHFYYWGLVNYVSSYSLKINSQFQTGLGIGYDLIDGKNALLLISDGILYDKSDLNTAVLGHIRYETSRNSFRIKYRWVIQDRVVLTGSHFYQQSLSSGSDYIIISSAAASIRIKKWLSFNVAENYNKLNRTGRQNLLITYGLLFERFF